MLDWFEFSHLDQINTYIKSLIFNYNKITVQKFI